MDMKTIIITMIALISSSVCAQESIKVIGLKNTDAEAVAGTLKSVIQAVDKDDKDKKRPSTEKMAEVMFKRIDIDKNGSLSLKEFQTFYARIRSSRSDRSSSDRSSRSRSDRSRSSRSDRSDRPSGDSSRREIQGFGKDKKDRGPDK
tara:strand:- start:37 stop:477 length:441 start_codon:yes stop_codon:yes gene_type:complete